MIEYSSMNISVIIPTHNAGFSLQELISRLASQDLPPNEIIIIDSSSSDNTTDIAKKSGAFVMTIPKESFDHGRTRNTAALKAKGEILVFMTQDALPANPSLLRLLTAPLLQGDIVAACGRHLPKDDASPLEVFARRFNYPEQGSIKGIGDIQKYGIKTFFFSNVCSAYRRGPFIKIGSHNYSLLNQFRRYYNIGASLRNNSWIFQYARPEGEGLQFIRQQISYVLKQHKYSWVPYIFIEMVTKYAGYRIGLLAG